MKYIVKFDRIGRDHFARPIEVEVAEDDADGIAEAVFRHAKSKLASRWFEVYVDLDAGKGLIEAGRFGTFTVERADA